MNVISRDKMRLQDMRAVPARSRRAFRTVVLAAAVLVLVACSNGDDGKAQPARESTTTTAPGPVTTTSMSTTTSSTPGAAVLVDYNAAKAALEEAERLADPKYPPLVEHWVGGMLQEVQKQLAILQMNGWVIRGTTTHSPKVVTIDGRTAVVWDCIHTDGERYDAKTGAVVNPTGPVTVGYEETLTRDDAGVWKVSARVKQEQACPGT